MVDPISAFLAAKGFTTVGGVLTDPTLLGIFAGAVLFMAQDTQQFKDLANAFNEKAYEPMRKLLQEKLDIKHLPTLDELKTFATQHWLATTLVLFAASRMSGDGIMSWPFTFILTAAAAAFGGSMLWDGKGKEVVETVKGFAKSAKPYLPDALQYDLD